MELNTDALRARLETERDELVTQLQAHGRKIGGDWQGDTDAFETSVADRADKNIVADKLEELGTETQIVEQLETRYEHVLAALKRMDDGTYGTCEVGGEEIPAARLEANPAASTCVEHAS